MSFPYKIDEKYSTKVAYFSMEFAIHQSLKIYSGGLGYLSGSHMRSVFDLAQNVVGVGILWSYGYYDQERNKDRSMEVTYRRKFYYFLEDTGCVVSVKINDKDVFVKAMRLNPNTFSTAPIYLLTTDIPENDFLARTITHKLYDANEETRIAQEIVLGIGGAKVVEELEGDIEIYHMNEGHSLPIVFHLYSRFNSVEEVKKRVVFTTHTPEKAGNEEHNIYLLSKMGFFNYLDLSTVRDITKTYDDSFNLTVGALRLSKITNAVSKIHLDVTKSMWGNLEDISPIISITNAQNRKFWADKQLVRAYEDQEDYELIARKKHLKRVLFDEVADQTGKFFDPEVLTIVWARRFVDYKRPGLIKYDFDRFVKLITRDDMPIQMIWAGKPHPNDSMSINLFNELIYTTKNYKRAAVLVGYELKLSGMLKKGADIWLNNPRITREASGTSGMSACMNGAIHLSIPDGWHPEFAKDSYNSFTIPACDYKLPIDEQDRIDNKNLMDMLENEIIPLYYTNQKKWIEYMKHAMRDIMPNFESGRMANEYYEKLYNYNPSTEYK